MSILNPTEFGSLLKKRRKQLHYTQKFLSDFSGLSISFISDVENGKDTVELGKALKLANLLGLNCVLEERD